MAPTGREQKFVFQERWRPFAGLCEQSFKSTVVSQFCPEMFPCVQRVGTGQQIGGICVIPRGGGLAPDCAYCVDGTVPEFFALDTPMLFPRRFEWLGVVYEPCTPIPSGQLVKNRLNLDAANTCLWTSGLGLNHHFTFVRILMQFDPGPPQQFRFVLELEQSFSALNKFKAIWRGPWNPLPTTFDCTDDPPIVFTFDQLTGNVDFLPACFSNWLPDVISAQPV